MSGKLHELLAVESELRATAQRMFSHAKATFTDGRNRLLGMKRVYSPLEQDGEPQQPEVQNISLSATGALDEMLEAFRRWTNASIQKEVTNMGTSASVEVGNEVLIEDLPATALLNLEGKLAELRAVYLAIPTYDPTEVWEWSEDLDCFQSEVTRTFRTKKVPRSHVLYDATPEHPAQVEQYFEDVQVGIWSTQKFTTMMSPLRKRTLLANIDTLLRAVKQARQRANDTEVIDVHVAATLIDFIYRE